MITPNPTDPQKRETGYAAGLLRAIEMAAPRFTRTDRRLAAYLTERLSALPFETADAIAAKTGVSAVSVGRFCRKLGYGSFRDLKAQLRGAAQWAPWLAGEGLDTFLRTVQDDRRLRASFDAEVGAIVDIYRQAAEPDWDLMLSTLAGAGTVLVAGLQTERGLASLLAYQLQYIRPNVRLLDLGSGHFSDLLDGAGQNAVLILFDTIRYSTLGERLCRSAAESGLAVVVISDSGSQWARAHARHRITVDAYSAMFWPSVVPFACAINLIVNGVLGKIGGAAAQRVETVSRRYHQFVGQFSSR